MVREAKIGIWGPRESGKTTFLVSLYLEMSQPNSDWHVTLEDNHTREFMKTATGFMDDGTFPAPTDIGQVLRLGIEHKRSANFIHRLKTYDLQMLDASGSLVDSRIGEISPDIRQEYFAYLRECNGILMIIDPESKYRNGPELSSIMYHDLLEEFFAEVPINNNGEKPYIAFCITKMDLNKHWENRNNPDYLDKVIGTSASRLVYERCGSEQFKVFPISAVGRYLTPEGLERPNVIETMEGLKIARNERISLNLKSGLLWLFGRIDKNTLLWFERFGRKSTDADL